MGVTLKDIAEVAGVSMSTVSKVLNGYIDVASATREKVLLAAETLGYKATTLSSSKRHCTGCIGLLINESPKMLTYTPFVLTLMGALRQIASQKGIELRLYPLDPTMQDNETELLNIIDLSAIDGILLVKATDPLPLKIIRTLKQEKIPLVILGTAELTDIMDVTCVSPNNMLAASQVVEHLHNLGHRRILFLSESQEHAGFLERYSGYRLAMWKHGLLPYDEEKALFPSRKAALDYLHFLLKSDKPPTAVFACGDELAAAVLKVASENGIPVPERLSVVGFDDQDMAKWVNPPLTTNQLPAYEMAVLAIDEIKRLSKSGKFAAVRHSISCRLVVRNSTTTCPSSHISNKEVN